jgi:signal transduction histidine kinase
MESSTLDIIHRFIGKRSWWLLVLVAAIISCLIGWVDYITGWEWSLFVFYAVPIFLVSWYLSQRVGIVISVLCGAIWWVANESVNPYRTGWGYALAALTRLAYFMFVAVGTSALRARDEANRARIAALEHTRDLEQDLVSISEHEQRRIGQDIHDSLCQNLAAIACAVRSYNDDLISGHKPNPEEGREIERLLKDATLEARHLARRFFPAHLEGIGLAAALQELVSGIHRGSGGSNIVFHERGSVEVSEPETAMHLFRIVQEALNNAIKHARASHISVTLDGGSDDIRVSIEDDGTGPDAISETRQGMGLKTMRYRARLIGASLSITRSPMGGTLVHCSAKQAPPNPQESTS